jgi:uncharacterized protein (TIGR00106 family)
MPLVSIKVIPVGVGTSLSRYIARVVALLESKGYKPRVTADTTVLTVSDVSEVGAIVKMVHDELYSMGVQRIITLVMIDERRDVEERTPEELVQSVLAKLDEERRRISHVRGVM